jgi:hypothetical protein
LSSTGFGKRPRLSVGCCGRENLLYVMTATTAGTSTDVHRIPEDAEITATKLRAS